MTTVLVLGASGMLGAMVVDWLRRDHSIVVRASVREPDLLEKASRLAPEVSWCLLSLPHSTEDELLTEVQGCDWIINAIGVTKPYIQDSDSAQVKRAIDVNALFPHVLARIAERCEARVLQIATDCVFSGQKGPYSEVSPHDATDVYGKTKSLGEVHSERMSHLRCSIVGPEPSRRAFLLEWFLSQLRNAEVSGFTNHVWNGITTLHFAKLCHGIIRHPLDLPDLQHLVPADCVTKANLLRDFGKAFRRDDIYIVPSRASLDLDRTLTTVRESVNISLWEAAGYPQPPSIVQMLEELAAFDFQLVDL